MKTVSVSELKAHLSKYLRIAAGGEAVVVKDREEPIAQIGPPQADAPTGRLRLEREGRLRRGTQDWARLDCTPLAMPVDAQEALQAVREEPGEVRRR